MKHYWRALGVAVLCSYKQWHDTFPKPGGICKRCHLEIGPDGNAVVR